MDGRASGAFERALSTIGRSPSGTLAVSTVAVRTR